MHLLIVLSTVSMGWFLGCQALFRTLGMGVYNPSLSVACAQGSCGWGEVGSHSQNILLQDGTVQEVWGWQELEAEEWQ